MKFIALAVALAFVVAAPWVITDAFYVHLMIMVLMWTVLGAAWNILGGFAGQVSFGHSAFLGAGAYTTMILYLRLGTTTLVWYRAGRNCRGTDRRADRSDLFPAPRPLFRAFDSGSG